MNSKAVVERRELEIRLHGYWHAGSGLGSATGADAQVTRTAGGLPFLPGRTLKGILREAVELGARYEWIRTTSQDLVAWFGTPLVRGEPLGEAIDQLEEARYASDSGCLRVGSARLGRGERAAQWERWARCAAHAPQRDLLFHELASTALDAGGVAKSTSLRLIEVAVPVHLHAEIEGPPAALDAIAAALPLIRAVGAHRTRGLGRATLRMGEP